MDYILRLCALAVLFVLLLLLFPLIEAKKWGTLRVKNTLNVYNAQKTNNTHLNLLDEV